MKKSFLVEEYVTPALDVISTTVEAGFGLSNGKDVFDAGLADVDEIDGGSF